MVDRYARFFSTRRNKLFSRREASPGSGTRISAASRDMRAQCRSKANSTPSITLMVLNTPQPESRPTWPGESSLSDVSRMSSLWRVKRCMRAFILQWQKRRQLVTTTICPDVAGGIPTRRAIGYGSRLHIVRRVRAKESEEDQGRGIGQLSYQGFGGGAGD